MTTMAALVLVLCALWAPTLFGSSAETHSGAESPVSRGRQVPLVFVTQTTTRPDLAGLQKWVSKLLSEAPTQFTAIRGEQIRTEQRARGSVAQYHLLLAIPPGFRQEIRKTSTGTYASGNVILVTAPGNVRLSMASYSFDMPTESDAVMLFNELVRIAKASASSNWRVERDTATAFEASDPPGDVNIEVQQSLPRSVTLNVTYRGQ